MKVNSPAAFAVWCVVCLALIVSQSVLRSTAAQPPTPAATSAQSGTTPPTKTKPSAYPARKKPYKRDMKTFSYKVLKKAPDLPNLPAYPGNAKFVDAAVYPEAKGGPTFHVQLTCQDPPSQVIQWYQQSLSQYKWNVTRSTAKAIHARKDGNSVNIFIMTRSNPKSTCDVLITYLQKSS